MMAETFWIEIRLRVRGNRAGAATMSSLRTLAKSLNLSITTVSRALDGYPDVSETTRAAREGGGRGDRLHPQRRGAPPAQGHHRGGDDGAAGRARPFQRASLYRAARLASASGSRRRGYDLALIAAPPGPDELKALPPHRRGPPGGRAGRGAHAARRRPRALPLGGRLPLRGDGPDRAAPSPTPSWTATASRPSSTRRAGCRRSATGASSTSPRPPTLTFALLRRARLRGA